MGQYNGIVRESKILTQDGVEVIQGMTVWVYPANERLGGPIKEKLATYVQAPWFLYFNGKLGLQVGDRHDLRGHAKLYSTKEIAEGVRAKDKTNKPWMARGKFGVSCAATIIGYLAHKTGIDKSQIQAHRPCSVLHVSWADSKGMHKEKLRIGSFYDVTEDNLAPLVAQMKGTA